MFSKRKFTILVGEDDTRSGCKQEHTFIFHLVDEKACKHLWKCAVEYHAFFRLRTSPRQLQLTGGGGASSANGSGASAGGLFNGFIRRGSRFRGPERTEYQTINMQRLTTPRRSVQFERKPSQRFSRRASYAVKRRQLLQDHQSNAQAAKPLSDQHVFKLPLPVAQRSTVGHQASRQQQQNGLVPSVSDTKLDGKAKIEFTFYRAAI